jgi:hypothetical protein
LENQRITTDAGYAQRLLSNGTLSRSSYDSLLERYEENSRPSTTPPTSQRETITQLLLEFDPLMHAKRRKSLENAIQALVEEGKAQCGPLQRTIAAMQQIRASQAKRRFDVLLSNNNIFNASLWERWTRFITKDLLEVPVILDNTVFHDSDQITMFFSLMLTDKMTIPLLPVTLTRTALGKGLLGKGTLLRTAEAQLVKLGEWIGWEKIIMNGDREFGTVPWLKMFDRLGLYYNVRVNDYVVITKNSALPSEQKRKSHKKLSDSQGRNAVQWLHGAQRAQREAPTRYRRQQIVGTTEVRSLHLQNVHVTREEYYPVPHMVIYHETGQKHPWVIASNLPNVTVRKVVDLYGCRWRTAGVVGEMLRINRKVQIQEGQLHLFNRGRELAKYYRYETKRGELEIFWGFILIGMPQLSQSYDRSKYYGSLLQVAPDPG